MHSVGENCVAHEVIMFLLTEFQFRSKALNRANNKLDKPIHTEPIPFYSIIHVDQLVLNQMLLPYNLAPLMGIDQIDTDKSSLHKIRLCVYVRDNRLAIL